MTSGDSIAIRQADDADLAVVAALRRRWTEELAGQPAADDGFEERLTAWYAAEKARRVTFLAEIADEVVGMANLALFERMPKPGQPASRWAYLSNAFVLAAHRDKGAGTALIDALVGHARELGCARIVLSRPSVPCRSTNAPASVPRPCSWPEFSKVSDELLGVPCG